AQPAGAGPMNGLRIGSGHDQRGKSRVSIMPALLLRLGLMVHPGELVGCGFDWPEPIVAKTDSARSRTYSFGENHLAGRNVEEYHVEATGLLCFYEAIHDKHQTQALVIFQLVRANYVGEVS